MLPDTEVQGEADADDRRSHAQLQWSGVQRSGAKRAWRVRAFEAATRTTHAKLWRP